MSQSLVLAAPMGGGGRTAEARAAQAQLAALLGPGVLVCSQSDDPASPPPADCHDACPLCRLAAELAALDAPAAPIFAAPFQHAVAAEAATAPFRLPAADAGWRPLPRGPPSRA